MFGKYLVAAITPFNNNGEIDQKYFSKLFPLLERNHVDTVVVFGTNGEGPSLSFSEINQGLKLIMDNLGKIEVIMCIFCTSINETIEKLTLAEDYHVSGVLLAPPYYFKNIREAGLYKYFVKLISRSSLPVLLYNIPKYTGVPFTVELINRLTEFSQFVGIKDSSGDKNQTYQFIQNFPNLKVYSGNDSLIYQALQLECQGVITALGNVFPDIVFELIQNFKEKRFDEAKKDQNWLTEIRTIIKMFPQIASIKCCMERYLGLPPTFVKPPLVNLKKSQKTKMFQLLDELVKTKINIRK